MTNMEVELKSNMEMEDGGRRFLVIMVEPYWIYQLHQFKVSSKP